MTRPIHRTQSRTLAALSIVALAVPMTMTMSGCLIASSKESSISGAYVQPGAVSKVRVNTTTSSEVEEILGQPSNSVTNDDGTETWTWNWTKTTEDDGAVFLIFAGESEKTVHESVHIKFVDGIAVKKWRD
jgi:outer membrane protein assembly factor BamE (lipoprotein component of BamABCDE complex)